MLQGVCVDPGQSAVLDKGKSYYLFPNGSKHFYVSNFPDQEAHMRWGYFPLKLQNELDMYVALRTNAKQGR